MKKLLGIILVLACAGSAAAWDLELTAAEIRARVIGNTIIGIEDGKFYAAYLSPSGVIYGRDGNDDYRGYWRIVDNRLCLGYEADNPRTATASGKFTWTCANVALSGKKLIWNDRNDVSFSTLVPGRAEQSAVAKRGAGF